MLSRGFLKGIEIDDNHVDGEDFVSGDGCFVFGIATDIEEAAMHAGVEGFDASIEHFGKAGEVADVADGESGVAEGARCSAG